MRQCAAAGDCKLEPTLIVDWQSRIEGGGCGGRVGVLTGQARSRLMPVGSGVSQAFEAGSKES